MTSLMLIVLTLSVVITVMRFGISVLEDNFVADLSTSYGSSAEFMSFYGLLNFYLYTMAYVYTPPPNAFLGNGLSNNGLIRFTCTSLHRCRKSVARSRKAHGNVLLVVSR